MFVQKAGLRCTQRVWKEQKSAYCNEGDDPYTNNKVKFINCNPHQRTIMIKAIEGAKVSVQNNERLNKQLLIKVLVIVLGKSYVSPMLRSKIKNKLFNWNMRINCQEEMKRCSKGPNAHTFWTELNSIKVCSSYLNSSNDKWKEAELARNKSPFLLCRC